MSLQPPWGLVDSCRLPCTLPGAHSSDVMGHGDVLWPCVTHALQPDSNSGALRAVKRTQEQTANENVGLDLKRFRFDLEELPFHSDQGATDLIALLAVNKAKRGGSSKWVSGIAIHNELLRRGRKVQTKTGAKLCVCVRGRKPAPVMPCIHG